MSLKPWLSTYRFTGLHAHARPGMLPHAVPDDMDAVRTIMERFAVHLNQGKGSIEYVSWTVTNQVWKICCTVEVEVLSGGG